jgi:hypothetical protein
MYSLAQFSQILSSYVKAALFLALVFTRTANAECNTAPLIEMIAAGALADARSLASATVSHSSSLACERAVAHAYVHAVDAWMARDLSEKSHNNNRKAMPRMLEAVLPDCFLRTEEVTFNNFGESVKLPSFDSAAWDACCSGLVATPSCRWRNKSTCCVIAVGNSNYLRIPAIRFPTHKLKLFTHSLTHTLHHTHA